MSPFQRELTTAACFFSALAMILFLSGCGPKIRTSPHSEELSHLSSLAVLPIDRDPKGGTTKDRLDYLRSSLSSKLRSHGFSVVDDSLVDKACGDRSCSRSSELFATYRLDGAVRLEVDSVRRSNFLAGYINSVTGAVTISNSKTDELLSVSLTEQERGGLLFNTGQLVEGIVSQIENSGEISFTRLADRFIDSIIRELPEPATQTQNAEETPVSLSEVKLKQLRPEIYQVCAYGSPASEAQVLIKGRGTPLRSTKDGEYCSVIRIDKSHIDSAGLLVELKSPFGQTARQSVALETGDPCLPKNSVQLIKRGLLNRVEVECLKLRGQLIANASCTENSQCEVDRLLVYRGPSLAGPYRKVAEVTSNGWTDLSANSREPFFYQIVSMGKSGAFSTPLTLNNEGDSTP